MRGVTSLPKIHPIQRATKLTIAKGEAKSGEDTQPQTAQESALKTHNETRTG